MIRSNCFSFITLIAGTGSPIWEILLLCNIDFLHIFLRLEFHKQGILLFLTMLSCPRCGTGNLKEGSSLSIHLTRYCMGPSLLFHAQRGILSKKRSHEFMLSGSCPSTYQQQIRNFNSLPVNVSVLTINTLHGMPSLLHLSSTQSELGNWNVHYYGFDTDLSTPASVDDQINTNYDSVTDPVIEKCFLQRNTICQPPDIAFQVHLLSQMNTHRGNDLNMFNEVIQCIKAHAIQYNMNYTTLQILSRKQLVHSQNTMIWIFSSQHYIQCPLQMDMLVLFLYLMLKPFWLHFLMIPWECARRTFNPIMISLQERWNRQHQLLMKYIHDHFDFWSRLDKNTVVMIQMNFP